MVVVRVPPAQKLPATFNVAEPVKIKRARAADPLKTTEPLKVIVHVLTVISALREAVTLHGMYTLEATRFPAPTTTEVVPAVGIFIVMSPVTVRVIPEFITTLFDQLVFVARVRLPTVASAVTVIVTAGLIVTVSVALGIPPTPVQPDHLLPSFQFPVAVALQAASEAICQT